jgi:hypothetical protein
MEYCSSFTRLEPEDVIANGYDRRRWRKAKLSALVEAGRYR